MAANFFIFSLYALSLICCVVEDCRKNNFHVYCILSAIFALLLKVVFK